LDTARGRLCSTKNGASRKIHPCQALHLGINKETGAVYPTHKLRFPRFTVSIPPLPHHKPKNLQAIHPLKTQVGSLSSKIEMSSRNFPLFSKFARSYFTVLCYCRENQIKPKQNEPIQQGSLLKMNLIMKRITAFGLLLTIMLGMITVCCAHNISSHDAKTSISFSHLEEMESCPQAQGDGSPSSPDNSHSGHSCEHACHCSCHAPLAGSPILFNRAISFTLLNQSEITWYLPKVYLSLFVPPDSTNVF